MPTASNKGRETAAAYHPPPVAMPSAETATVLVISPFDADLAFIRKLFSNSKWKIRGAASCREARPQFQGTPVSAVLCEKDLPDGTWRDVLDELARLDDPPLLIVTSRLADDYLWAEVLNLGGYDVLIKPFDSLEVSRVLGQACRSREASHAHYETERVKSASGD